MATQIVMPQLGESVAEGVIGKWLKQEGDPIEKDEPIVEVVTDKVNAEIPSPVGGTLQKITAAEGATVAVGEEIAVIGDGADTGAESANAGAGAAPEASTTLTPSAVPTATSSPEQAAPQSAAVEITPQSSSTSDQPNGGQPSNGRTSRVVRSSPLVQRLAAEHNVDLAQVPGTGIGGRVSKKDILQYIQGGQATSPVTAPATSPATVSPEPEPAAAPSPAVSMPRSTSGAVSARGRQPEFRAAREDEEEVPLSASAA